MPSKRGTGETGKYKWKDKDHSGAGAHIGLDEEETRGRAWWGVRGLERELAGCVGVTK